MGEAIYDLRARRERAETDSGNTSSIMSWAEREETVKASVLAREGENSGGFNVREAKSRM